MGLCHAQASRDGLRTRGAASVKAREHWQQVTHHEGDPRHVNSSPEHHVNIHVTGSRTNQESTGLESRFGRHPLKPLGAQRVDFSLSL